MKLIQAVRNQASRIAADIEDSRLFAQMGDRGTFRELIIQRFLRPFLAECYGLSAGEVFSADGERSAQVDIVIFDAVFSTVLFRDGPIKLFPAESVFGSIEVKSSLTSPELDLSCRNIASVKQLQRPASDMLDFLPFVRLNAGTPPKVRRAEPKITHSVLELLRHSSLINIMKQTAVALDAAHRLGVVHLDLKPSNLFVKPTGRFDGNGAAEYDVHLTDFGFLYLQLAGLPLRGISALSDVLDYLAPEIVRDPRLGIDSDLAKYARSDIYAFGKLGLYLFSGPFDQQSDSQIDALVRFDPRLAVLLVRCALPNVAQRPQGFSEVIARLNTVQMDVDERCKAAKEVSKDESVTPLFKWVLRAVRAFSVSPGDIVLAFDDSRQIEAKIGGLVPFILFGYAIKALFLSDPKVGFTVNTSYIPCFLAASTCALIGYLYFKYITCRCQYYRSPAREAIRAAQCFQYGVPIVIGVTWPQWWPFCTAAGFLVVAINNCMMFGYMSEYDQEKHLPYLFNSNRRHMTEVLRGYVGSGICGVLGLLIAGGVLVWFRASNIHTFGAYGFELACGVLVAVVNFVLIKTAVVGEPGDRIARTLAQEYAIRDQPVVPDIETSEVGEDK